MSKILSLDIATHTGFCVDGIYGVWDLTPKRDESKGMRLIRFKSKLKDILSCEKPDIVVYERPGGFHIGAVIVESELVGVLKVFCEENKIEYRAYSSSEIKKYATGKGNSNKEAMIKAAKEKYGYEGSDDNEADAIHLFHLAQQDLKG